MRDWHVEEYKSLRKEIVARVQFMHQTLNLSVILQIALFVIGYYLYLNGYDIVLFILLAPVFLNFLTFNYQSNQMTLEAISKYIHESLNSRTKDSTSSRDALEWDRYFADHKAHYKFEAFFKVMPLIFPNVIPLALLVLQIPLNPWELTLLIFDLVLLLIIAENFRYKLRRVK